MFEWKTREQKEYPWRTSQFPPPGGSDGRCRAGGSFQRPTRTPEGAAVRKSVILSEGRSPKSKDLRIKCLLSRWQVRRSFDSLCSLRMTGGRFVRIRRGGRSVAACGTVNARSLQFRKIVFGKSNIPSTAVRPRCMQVCTGIFHKIPQLYLCIHPKFSRKTPIFLKKGNNCAILYARILESFPKCHHS